MTIFIAIKNYFITPRWGSNIQGDRNSSTGEISKLL